MPVEGSGGERGVRVTGEVFTDAGDWMPGSGYELRAPACPP